MIDKLVDSWVNQSPKIRIVFSVVVVWIVSAFLGLESIFGIIILFSLLGWSMVGFLDGSSRSPDTNNRDELRDLRNEMRSKFKQITLQVSAESEDELTEKLADRIKSIATEDFLTNIEQKVDETQYRLEVSRKSKATLDRIYREIDALGRRGTINLVLGVLTALSGVLALTFFVLGHEGESLSPGAFAMEFLPRLSIVIIIEVFSYFFLRLYKASLSEIKYFQNEATNIEHNFVALEAAIKIEDKALIEKCVLAFLNVERNPILQSDQITREILSERSEHEAMKFSTDQLVEILRATKQEKNKNSP